MLDVNLHGVPVVIPTNDREIPGSTPGRYHLQIKITWSTTSMQKPAHCFSRCRRKGQDFVRLGPFRYDIATVLRICEQELKLRLCVFFLYFIAFSTRIYQGHFSVAERDVAFKMIQWSKQLFRILGPKSIDQLKPREVRFQKTALSAFFFFAAPASKFW